MNEENSFSEEQLRKVVDGILEIEQKKVNQVNPVLVHEEILKLLRAELR